jgi:UDP-N-acetylmuramoylalanine--D-glutamate ligase
MTIQQYLTNKKILVFGLGRQGGGQGDVAYLSKHGFAVRVSDEQTLTQLGLTSDQLISSVEYHLGDQTLEDIEWSDLIIKNPGVPDDHPLIAKAKELGKTIVSSVALFVKYSPCTTVGITGTRGKSTTTELIYQVLDHHFPGLVIKGGNIPGTSGLSLFDLVQDKKFAVLELSSFQLHSFHDMQVSPKIAVVTNIYPDHLNRYGGMKEYVHDKAAIIAYQKLGDFATINADNEEARAMGQSLENTPSYFSATDIKDWQLTIPGEHNRQNVAAMWSVVKYLGISESEAQAAIQDFTGIPFRQEKIGVVGGVTYINDTTATTPVAATFALRAQTCPFILICGGATKNLPLDIFLDEIKSNILLKKIILLGSHNIPEFTTPLNAFAKDKIIAQVDSMKEAVIQAHAYALPGEVVLLSPGFVSFDLFQNEFDRGRKFNDCVKSL